MFRHSDGNKNSWEREKANKAFLSIRHHRHNWRLHFIKISEVFGRCVFCDPPVVAWVRVTKFRDSTGAPLPHICLILQPDLSPAAHFFCPQWHTFSTFWPEFVPHLKSSYSSRQPFPVAAEARMLHNGAFYPNISPHKQRPKGQKTIHCNAAKTVDERTQIVPMPNTPP